MALLTVGNWHNPFHEIKIFWNKVAQTKKKERENNQIPVRVMRLMTIQIPLFSLICLLLSNFMFISQSFFLLFLIKRK